MLRYLLRGSTGQVKFAVAKPAKIKTFYQILEVPTNATPTTIKKNYLKLAKIYHPDVYKGADRTRFQKIQEAYKVLSHQADRTRYDETIGLQSAPPPDY
jgi:curved DNA-binding protein CbpA